MHRWSKYTLYSQYTAHVESILVVRVFAQYSQYQYSKYHPDEILPVLAIQIPEMLEVHQYSTSSSSSSTVNSEPRNTTSMIPSAVHYHHEICTASARSAWSIFSWKYFSMLSGTGSIFESIYRWSLEWEIEQITFQGVPRVYNTSSQYVSRTTTTTTTTTTEGQILRVLRVYPEYRTWKYCSIFELNTLRANLYPQYLGQRGTLN